MKVTRRQLAVSLVAASALAQTPAPPANQDWAKEALESHQRNSMILASFPVPMSTEPAFQFKA